MYAASRTRFAQLYYSFDPMEQFNGSVNQPFKLYQTRSASNATKSARFPFTHCAHRHVDRDKQRLIQTGMLCGMYMQY